MTNYCRYSDEDIWTSFTQGDSQALDLIVKNNYNLLYNYGRKFSADASLVKDCMQDMFLALWKNRQHIGHTPSVKHYLMKALRRRLEREFAKNSHHAPAGTLEFLEMASPETYSPEVKKILSEQSSELSKRMAEALGTLSKRQQEIIYLRFYLNADAAAIAGIMSLSRQSVYNLLQSAIGRLREASQLFTAFGTKYVLSIAALLLCAAS